MEQHLIAATRQPLLALTLVAFPVVAAATVALDQAMRRPSLARFLVQSLQLSF